MIYSRASQRYEFDGATSLDIPLVEYNEKKFSSKEELDAFATKLMILIKSKIDLTKSCVIHAHNINLMKNSYIGRALQFLADDQKNNPNFLIILQVHDFAEDNRPKLLELMQTSFHDSGLLAYPIANNIIYCAINSRDRNLLEKIGIPKERVFLFQNNIDSKFLGSKPKNEGLKQKIKDYAKTKGYHFAANRKILLSPIKIIERKNVIECLLLLNLFNSIKDEWQLLVTLDAHSDKDMEYSNLIKEYVKKNKLPVVIGFGYDLISGTKQRTIKFPHNMVDLFSISDMIITTSKNEGFGMTYLEPWVVGKPVIGRRIDFLFNDFEHSGLDFSHFYNEIMINGHDFKDYDSDEQIRLLDEADLSKLSSQEGIKRLMNFIDHNKDDIIKKNRNAIIKNCSLGRYYEKLINMIDSGLKLTKNKNESFKINNSYIIGYFKRADNR